MLDRVRLVAPIALDPCGGRGSLVRAAVEFYEDETDGLAQSWNVSAAGIAYVNPPYGGAIGDWLAKALAELPHIDTIALITARPDTKWWTNTVAGKAALVCFWRGRLKFMGAKNGAPFPSALVLYSQDVSRQDKFRAAFGDVGHVFNP